MAAPLAKYVVEEPSNKKLLVIGSDHAGYQLRVKLVEYLKKKEGWDLIDVGVHAEERCDYPDFAKEVCLQYLNPKREYETKYGIVVCGSGIGISMSANKVNGIRCALCHDHYTAEMSRQHNDANVIAIGGRIVEESVAYDMVDTFLSTSFEGGRHTGRIEKMHAIEKSQ
ncbi:sugar-phosphate isomerase, RpiB/LacA/LacB family [Piromyces finnis]|uniref:Sugar-phosphate isomerase, RpiB/LacA/LacB family n=1 Tax=Piromyces finnis TaxID=1754191 RepID=A0A1Y1VHF1_9FUNG|nr:sugar-phosphate isomerase, RpiB/LacA/LacB family [Piromyces finnis]|eukprot:ORX55452.1 sugar-phosphate isomerase, RpiB/LacA/LacB family [Piromyces finnis]